MDQNGVGAQKRGHERAASPMFDSFPAWGCMRFMRENFWRGPDLSSDPDFFAPEPHFEQNPASLEPSCSLTMELINFQFRVSNFEFRFLVD